MSSDTGTPATIITRDNIHLSEPICRDVTATHAGDRNNPLSLCTDPAVLRFVEAATSKNTVRAYNSDLAHFIAWGGAIPADSQFLAQYVAAHANTLSAATLARRLVAIRCQSALDRDPVSASKRDPLVLRFERLAFAPSELAGVAETGRARVDV